MTRWLDGRRAADVPKAEEVSVASAAGGRRPGRSMVGGIDGWLARTGAEGAAAEGMRGQHVRAHERHMP